MTDVYIAGFGFEFQRTIAVIFSRIGDMQKLMTPGTVFIYVIMRDDAMCEYHHPGKKNKTCLYFNSSSQP
jgi:hypothetical protein